MNKTNKVLERLRNGYSVSGLDALKLFGLYRLSSVIHNLRMRGYNIVSHDVKLKDGTRYSFYTLEDK